MKAARNARRPPAAPEIDLDESPLGWLARRRDKSGKPILDASQLMAGERLRADFTRGQIMPRMSVDLSLGMNGGGRSGRTGGVQDLSDSALAARDRVNRALGAVGPELSGLLVDVCCFLKGLELVERERGWPARSGKVVLLIALSRLADHYGYGREARGAARSSGPTHWGAEDYRPRIDP
jgi:hypothetical protein